VIVPVHGQSLNNPHFRGDGPPYHVIVISGYDDQAQEFIVQEIGTMYGEDYRYKYSIVMNAMHDFLPNNQTINGRQVAIFTQKQIQASASLDGDFDSLTKQDELKYGSVLFLYDSDGDGYSDGEEVKNGYPPTLAGIKAPNLRLVKATNQPEIYLIENNLKRYIINLEVLQKAAAKYGPVVPVSAEFLAQYPRGADIIN
jgi:hypothetical protein